MRTSLKNYKRSQNYGKANFGVGVWLPGGVPDWHVRRPGSSPARKKLNDKKQKATFLKNLT
jgi:hypothetical protein